ncbi:DUF4041 domain-containing protein [Psychrobacter sp. Ps7]|uniref:DUF4041 domain-containing protein n=1 Tax=Psychrobacter sp. Ps7 TaxID=2790961 RepID=UPI001EDD9883|nr:DUF4041 domain-containing protein [Psychrobacter sp. Ps7]MCG3873698.1 DUF4041 domain-containing protein [Psychrobacter sp. Ps7]
MTGIDISVFIVVSTITFILGFIVAHKRFTHSLGSLNAIKKQFTQWYAKLDVVKDELSKANKEIEKLNVDIEQKQRLLNQLENKTNDLQRIEASRQTIERAFSQLPDKQKNLSDLEAQLEELKSELSLYTDMKSYVDYGFYPLPAYGEATSKAYNQKLKSIREEQKIMLRHATAYTYPDHIEITGNATYDKSLVKNQGNLLILAFNSESDYLISKINSNNYEAVLTRIEKLAEKLEKRLISLEIGISLDYVELKMQECTVYYQYKYQKIAEAEEQRDINAQMREEEAADREIQQALKEAKRDEQMVREAMNKVRKELAYASAEQKQQYEFQLQELTERLVEAESRKERSLSMAQQTRRGHVYIISNVGSFGEDIYKIGMTRRLEPLDRVKELSSASVPFVFDVHAMIYSEDAPALEKELHSYFDLASVNKVNSRKEFFEITLQDIRDYVESAGLEAHWTMAADATEYRQSLSILEQRMELAA